MTEMRGGAGDAGAGSGGAGSSGAGSGGAGDERVRFCLACGEVVAFEVRTCPSCGHYEPLSGHVDDDATRPCGHCGRVLPATLLYCPGCGRETEAAGPLRVGAPPEQPVRGGAGLAGAWIVALAVLAPLLLLGAALAPLLSG